MATGEKISLDVSRHNWTPRILRVVVVDGHRDVEP